MDHKGWQKTAVRHGKKFTRDFNFITRPIMFKKYLII